MPQITETDKDAQCFVKAKNRGENTFTFTARDLSSPKTIVFWIGENIWTAPPEKLHEALDDAIAMRNNKLHRVAD